MTSETGVPVQRPSDPAGRPDPVDQPDQTQHPLLRSRRPKALARAARQQELLAAGGAEPPPEPVASPAVRAAHRRTRTPARISAWNSLEIWAQATTRGWAWKKQIPHPKGTGVAAVGAVLVIGCGAAVLAISGDHDPAPVPLSSAVNETPSPATGQGLPTTTAVPEPSTDAKATPGGKPRKSSGSGTDEVATGSTGSGNNDALQNNEGTTKTGATPDGQKASSGTQDSPAKAGTQDAATTTAAGGNTASSAGGAAGNVVTVGVIRNLITGFCADLPGRAAADENVLVRQNTCAPGASDNQQFQTVAAADGTFLLRNVASGWCLDVDGSGSVESGTVVNTHGCLPGSQDNQMFRKQAQGNGFFLVHVKTGMCLNVSNPYGVDNKVADLKLTLYACSAKDDHIWTFG
ncbi:RICIN domain-containing protein [Kineosporia sp. J2-2]|uniref:RICIN domain-containing protein n=1 Tax=Kineosporia corallincola TaxID=2835133 RepID=A0ABS5TCE2_9ACTN|nr:RICIN domain-containing protein [Kineosporia corallincola]MBT0768518.1 RICIN domain-containing protein [Kineosporia corallincola]